ncbi:hypothetical protein B0H12DRAFT_1075389 [Mycena haematopus]|nr:hypothetical protein B0H12DRAFT_1075389 [Mycena haematopus]
MGHVDHQSHQSERSFSSSFLLQCEARGQIRVVLGSATPTVRTKAKTHLVTRQPRVGPPLRYRHLLLVAASARRTPSTDKGASVVTVSMRSEHLLRRSRSQVSSWLESDECWVETQLLPTLSFSSEMFGAEVRLYDTTTSTARTRGMKRDLEDHAVYAYQEPHRKSMPLPISND